MPPGIQYKYYERNSIAPKYHSNVLGNRRGSLKTVKEQEAQLENLTRELEAERELVAHKVLQYRIGSETESMNSISNTDDTFQWGGPQDESLRFHDESHGLMDSCLQELENRGTMNFGEDNMNYMPDEQYGSRGDRYNSYSGSPHHDTSMHSSHASLHSNSRQQLKMNNTNLGSKTSLPHEHHNSDNYMPYSGVPRNYDDYRDSPVQSNGSPGGPGTPTRFNNYHDNPQNYRASPLTYGPNSQLGYGEPDALDANPLQQYRPDMHNHNDSFRRGPDDRYDGQPPEDSFYRQSPMPDDRYGGRPPDDPRSQYIDSSIGGVGGYPADERYHDDSYQQGHPNDSFQGPPLTDRYSQPTEEGYQRGLPGMHPAVHPDDSYPGQEDSFHGPAPQDNRYRDYHEDGYRGNPDDHEDGYRGNPNDHEDSYRGNPNDHEVSYRGNPNDLYDHQTTNPSFQQEALPSNYHGTIPQGYEDAFEGEPDRRHEGLPQVQNDPFSDDPFRKKQRSLLQLQQDEPYLRGSSPGVGSDRMGPDSYADRPPQYDRMDGQPSYEHEPQGRYYDDSMEPPMISQPMEDRPRTPSVNGNKLKWRQPDLQEVIDYLNHPTDAIKANAAAYLTHLSYMDDGIKQKIRGLDGIPLLVALLNNDYPEVHINACGALKNLSYGRNNDENKKAIKNAGGIPALIRLLRKTQDEDVKDAVTGILWNLSSCEDLKKAIIDDGLAVLVSIVIIPQSGWDKRSLSIQPQQQMWSSVFRNATGVLRNISSSGMEARKTLRECHGLVESLLYTLRTALDQRNTDNKPLENCVCTLRNLVFRIQEVEDPNFFKNRTATLQRQKKQERGEKTGCFGDGKKKSGSSKGKIEQNMDLMAEPQLPPTANEYKGLWSVDAVHYFLQLVTGANSVTLEAACGAIQNLAACDWKPAQEIRALVRKEKGLPSLVDLLTFEVERVVAAAATALRNLSIDERNKELVGKYAMKQLISNLPQENQPKAQSDETLCAVLACLNEVILNYEDFARSFCTEGGLPKLMTLIRRKDQYQQRTVKYAASVLKLLWKFKSLHTQYQTKGYTEKDFNPPVASSGGTFSQPNSTLTTPYNTINRPVYNMGYDDTTLSSRRGNGQLNSYAQMTNSNPQLVHGTSNPALNQQDMYGSRQGRLDDVPMINIGPGYSLVEEPKQHRNKPPVGGVLLFPNMPSEHGAQEPLYARVNKKQQDEMGGPPSPGGGVHGHDQGEGADSWV